MIKPLSDRVLLKPIKNWSSTSDFWIFLPENTWKELSFLYEVISVWPGKEWTIINVKSWDKVICWQYSWDEVKFDWKDYKIVAIEYILAIVE